MRERERDCGFLPRPSLNLTSAVVYRTVLYRDSSGYHDIPIRSTLTQSYQHHIARVRGVRRTYNSQIGTGAHHYRGMHALVRDSSCGGSSRDLWQRYTKGETLSHRDGQTSPFRQVTASEPRQTPAAPGRETYEEELFSLLLSLSGMTLEICQKDKVGSEGEIVVLRVPNRRSVLQVFSTPPSVSFANLHHVLHNDQDFHPVMQRRESSGERDEGPQPVTAAYRLKPTSH